MSDDLYHYTDSKGIEGIKKLNRIMPSRSGTSRDAHFGEGVYLTALAPDESDEILVRNNFGKFYDNKRDRVSHYVCIPASELPRVTKEAADKNRDVYLFPTSTGINLTNVEHTFGKRQKNDIRILS